MSRVYDILSSYRFTIASEAELQEGIARVLTEAGVEFSREYPLSATERPDFYVVDDATAIEVKVDGPVMAVTRQLQRYALHVEVSRLLLVTTRSRHLNIPREIAGQPLEILFLSGGIS